MSTAPKLKRLRYKTVDELLDRELKRDEGEDENTAALIQRLRYVRETKNIKRPDFLAICRWKSPRALRHYSKNTERSIQSAILNALSTRSERRRLEYLITLKGVNVPMASAIMTLISPERYGVIDIRVWQLLFAIGSVSTKPGGAGFSFKNWYHYLTKLRYLAKKHGVSVRTVERTLFRYHKRLQIGTLYGSQP